MKFRSLIPWYARIATKLLLSRLPFGYANWHRFNLFSHGKMDDPTYAHQVFLTHFERVAIENRVSGFCGLELGPGDSAMSAVVATAYGSHGYYLIDAGHFATTDPAPYRLMAKHLQSLGLAAPDLSDVYDLTGILAKCQALYGTQGLASLRSVPDQSVDFAWSHAVLEHVRRDEFMETMRELSRVLKPGGSISHRVDLKDHLGGGLNNLRIASRLWERDWMAGSGFYTNRLRFSEMLECFKTAGFRLNVLAVNRWDRSPIARSLLAPEFRHLSEDDLLVKEFDVLLTRN